MAVKNIEKLKPNDLPNALIDSPSGCDDKIIGGEPLTLLVSTDHV
jgi:hypothetical protein